MINRGQADVRRIQVLRELLRISSSTFKRIAIIIHIRYQVLILAERVKKYIKKRFSQRIIRFFIKNKYCLGKDE